MVIYILIMLGITKELIIAIFALLISIISLINSKEGQRVNIIKNYPLLLPHLKNLPYEDTDGAYPDYKGSNRTHYKIINKGDLDPKEWTFGILKKIDKKWIKIEGFSFNSRKEGAIIFPHGERGPFVPSIIQQDDIYDSNGLMLIKVIYNDATNSKYCTCQLYFKDIPQDGYINSEEEKRKKRLFKLFKIHGNGKCSNCRWNEFHMAKGV